jgi:hypothetical protein
MKRGRLLGLLLASTLLAACGKAAHTTSTTSTTATTPTATTKLSVGAPSSTLQLTVPTGATETTTAEPTEKVTGLGTTDCVVPLGGGHAGVCTPHGKSGSLGAPSNNSLGNVADISEFESCANHRVSVLIFRLYEAGLNRADYHAYCNGEAAKRWGARSIGYGFLRPPGGSAPSCAQQGTNTVEIGRRAHINGAYVADVEVRMPTSCPSEFVHRVFELTHNAAQVDYSAPGTWPGGKPTREVWGATYGSSHGCIGGVCNWISWQFSESFNCNGYVGDCSRDYGISRFTQAAPPPAPRKLTPQQRASLEHRRDELRTALASKTCRGLAAEHHSFGEPCTRWFKEGNEIAAKLKADHLTPAQEKALLGRREVLRRVLATATCRSIAAEHKPLGEPCTRWFKEGDDINARLRRGY